MKKSFKFVIAAVFLITGAVILSAKTYNGLPGQFAEKSVRYVPAQKSTSVRTMYLNNCARCHGSDGKADTELGRLYDATDLTGKQTKKLSRKKAARIIQNGDSSMPAFKKKLSAKEISALVSYIRTL